MGAGELTIAAADAAGLSQRAPQARRAGAVAERRVLERWLVPLLALHDLLAVVLAFGVAFALRAALSAVAGAPALPPDAAARSVATLLVLGTTALPLLYVLGLYDLRLLPERVPRRAAVVAAVTAQILAVTAWCFFRGEISLPRSVLLLYAAGAAALLLASRAVARRVLARSAPLRVALIGAPDAVAELQRQLGATERHGVALVGAVSPGDPPARSPGSRAELRWLGGTDDLARVARAHRLEQLIVLPAASDGGALLDAVLRAVLPLADVRVAVVPSVYELRVGRLASLHLSDVPLIEVARTPSDAPSFRVKAALDRLLAGLLLALALPILLPAAVLVRLTSSGPVLFRQRRVGRGGREFVMYKLRTMRVDAEHATGPVLARTDDERVTGPGRFLRATRIDEIPQLLNVLNGTMSLVGPRPERPEFAAPLAREVAGYAERWLVKPGLSGLAQVRGEYHTSPACKLKYDLAYIHNHTLLLDLRILAETVRTLLARRGV